MANTNFMEISGSPMADAPLSDVHSHLILFWLFEQPVGKLSSPAQND